MALPPQVYFYPRSPCGERRIAGQLHQAVVQISIHALLAESDGRHPHDADLCANFYPRSPCGERPDQKTRNWYTGEISIHALLAESDEDDPIPEKWASISIHALLAESDGRQKPTEAATWDISIHALLAESDLAYPDMIICTNVISIHALLAESDLLAQTLWLLYSEFLSTLSLRRATSAWGDPERLMAFLSTLSLRRATHQVMPPRICVEHFYPRSPCGERRVFLKAEGRLAAISIHALLAESDFAISAHCFEGRISIHALLAESDSAAAGKRAGRYYFYPRSPCGERQKSRKFWALHPVFLSTLSLRRATISGGAFHTFPLHFYPRSPCGERRRYSFK